MKKFRQLVSLTLSALMTFSCFSGLSAVGVSAAEEGLIGSSSVDPAGNSDFFPSTSKEFAVGASDGLNITAESNLFPDGFKAVSKTDLSGKDDLVTVSYYINTTKRLLDFDLELSFDPQKLEFTEDYNFDEDYNQKIMPQVSGDVVINDSTAGKIKCNFSSTQAKTKLSENGEFVPFLTVTFKALGSGDTTVALNVKDFRICDVKNRVADPDTIEWVVRESNVQSTQTPVSYATAAYAGTYTSYSEPAEQVTTQKQTPATQAPTTVPQVAAEGVYVNATSNLFPGQAKSFSDSDILPSGGYVTVTYFANCSKRLLDVDLELEYTDSILEFAEAYNFTEDGDQKIMPKLSGDAIVNTNTSGRVLLNFSSTQAKTQLTDNGNAVPFVTAVFKVLKSGNANVDLNVKDLRICDVKNRVADPDTIEWVVREGNAQSIQTQFSKATTVAPGVGAEIPESQTTIPNPVTQPASTTLPVVVGSGMYVKATSNLFQGTEKTISQQELIENNNYVTVTYFANCAKHLLDFDFDIEFDPAVLQFAEEYNFNEDYDQQFMPQVAGDIVINDSTAGKVKCNFSSTQRKHNRKS